MNDGPKLEIRKIGERVYGVGADVGGRLYSIEEASHMKEPAIWLGSEQMIGGDPSMRALLNQEMAKALLPLLTRFVETGKLS